MDHENATHQGKCYCGAVKVTVSGPPVAAGYCHCLECRKWHSAPINAFAIWPADQVTLEGDTMASAVSEDSARVSCRQCGGCVANRKPTMDIIGVYPMTLAGPANTFHFEPAFHIFYEERVMNVNDGLPKYVDLPEMFGGSGRTVHESQNTGWCSTERAS